MRDQQFSDDDYTTVQRHPDDPYLSQEPPNLEARGDGSAFGNRIRSFLEVEGGGLDGHTRTALLLLAIAIDGDASLLSSTKEGVLAMAVARLGGEVEGAPTHRGNFLQRIDQLRAIEARYDHFPRERR